MNFVHETFVCFLLVGIVTFLFAPSRLRAPLLLIMSYFFYATWSIPFLGVILLTTSADYWFSKIIHTASSDTKKHWALVSGLVINLLILFFFKYFNFFLNSGASLYHWMNMPFPFPKTISIILPLGISFYTFEAIGYLIDVYREEKPAKNWWEYNFYIMYFPHLISGPIIRFSELVHQYRLPIELPSVDRILKGIELIILGYFFKVLIADTAAPLVDTVYDDPTNASVLATYLATLGFTVQIYFDFMGYTHIARGVSLLFNIELPVNFNFPYLATNISDFWKRWHISLSRWIRDYLYIPLGGSRGSVLQTMTVLLATMTLCGAWHGAGWTYILWGTYHGFLLGMNHAYKRLQLKLCPPQQLQVLHSSAAYKWAGILITFVLVVLGWVLFRSPDLHTAENIFQRLFNISALFSEISEAWIKMWAQGDGLVFEQLAFLFFCCFIGPRAAAHLRSLYREQHFVIRTAIASAVILLCWVLTAKQTTSFIYFQF